MTTTTILPAGTAFARLCVAHAIGKGDPMTAAGFASARGWHHEADAIQRSVVTPTSQTDAAAVLKPYALDLSAALRPVRVIGRMPLLRTAPLRTRLVAGSNGASAAFVAEGAPAPMSAAAFNSATTIEAAKLVASVIQTEELFLHGLEGTQPLLLADIVGAIAEAEDEAFLQPDNAGGAGRPASITHGGVQITSSGNALANVDSDLRALVDAHISAGNTLQTATLVGHPRSLTYLGSLRGSGGDPAFPGLGGRGGVLWGLPVLSSASCSMGGSPNETFMAIVEQDQVIVADEGIDQISSTRHASLQMSDAPASGAQQLVPLWQNGMVGLMVTRWVNWKTRRAGAASSIVSIGF
jgi:HK97 family phage major capsid protein